MSMVNSVARCDTAAAAVSLRGPATILLPERKPANDDIIYVPAAVEVVRF